MTTEELHKLDVDNADIDFVYFGSAIQMGTAAIIQNYVIHFIFQKALKAKGLEKEAFN